MDELTIEAEAENLVRSAAAQLTEPRDRECLACFVARMLEEFGCGNTLRFAVRYRDLRAPRATRLEGRLGAMGGYCDCEVFLNGLDLAEGEDPEGPRPACRQVRRGSTQACANWVRRRRRRGW